jgi:hypothetical protein
VSEPTGSPEVVVVYVVTPFAVTPVIFAVPRTVEPLVKVTVVAAEGGVLFAVGTEKTSVTAEPKVCGFGLAAILSLETGTGFTVTLAVGAEAP